MIVYVKQFLLAVADQMNMNIVDLFDVLHVGINSAYQHLSDMTAGEKFNQVSAFSRKPEPIAPLELYRPNFTMRNSRDTAFGLIIFCIIALTDHSIFPFFFKVWLNGVIYFIYLVWIDWMRIPIIYKIPSRMSSNKQNHRFDAYELREQPSLRVDDDQRITISQCTFHIERVKLTDWLDTGSNSIINTSPQQHALSSSSNTVAIFEIVVTHPHKR